MQGVCVYMNAYIYIFFFFSRYRVLKMRGTVVDLPMIRMFVYRAPPHICGSYHIYFERKNRLVPARCLGKR